MKNPDEEKKQTSTTRSTPRASDNDDTNNNNTNSTNENSSDQQASEASKTRRANATASPPKAVPPPQPRFPARPSAAARSNAQLKRQLIVAAGGPDSNPHHSIELAGVIVPQVNGAHIVAPKRPTRLPARYAAGLGAHHVSSNGDNKPNRYSWAQMQQWHAAAAAAAAAAAGTGSGQATGAGAAAAKANHQGFHHHFSSPFSSAASRVLVVNPMQIVNLSEHTKSSLIKFIEAIKRFSEKWFSHVLLLLFLAVYACFGAYIFISFEAPTEMWEKQLIIDTRANIVNESWQEAKSKSQEEFLDSFRSKLEHYERLLNKVCASGMSSNSLDNQWTFWNALFYSMTVFTTIGYGHLTPITFAGRVATMIYAIFGIPILLMVLADLGKLLTRIIKYTFKKFRYLFNKLLRRKSSIKTRKLISDNTNHYLGATRNAIENSYTNYIHRPFINRIPQALRLNRFKSNRDEQPDELAHEESGNATGGAQLEEKSKTMPESTDIIVTPAKQTKPVSPQPGDKKSPFASNTNNDHHAKQQHHRSQSPAASASGAKRRVSTSGLLGSKRAHVKNTNALSKSASTNVVQASGSGDIKSASKKQPKGSTGSEQIVPAAAVGGANLHEPIELAPEGYQLNEDKLPEGVLGENISIEPIEFGNDDHDDHDEDEPGGELEQEMEDDFDIPVSFALFLLVTYMMFGAVVFSIWEGWNFFDSLYFVFISMSTIGFGDLVPQHPKRMIGTFIYLLFGLALTSMCINVVQEKIHATFLRAKMQIGEKMGFDLDQIMADDYFADSSLAYEGEDGQLDDSNSVALSQTNSASGANSNQPDHQCYDHLINDINTSSYPAPPVKLQSLSLDGSDQTLRQSKSKESLKGKKKPITSLPGHHNGSLKRKLSKRQQSTITSNYQPTNAPSSPDHLTSSKTHSIAPPSSQQQQQQQQQQPSSTINNPPALRSQIVVHSYEPVMLVDIQPSINAPITDLKSMCEPLQKIKADLLAGTTNNSSRPKLVATRSLQPPNSYQFEPARAGRSKNRANNLGRESQASNSLRPPVKSSSYQGRTDLEAALSRRSSVSQELNQLDDLIVALNKSPSERFGPLLGIPSSNRSSRSNSPTSLARRGTSMTNRPTHQTDLSRPQVKKIGSLTRDLSQPLNLSESQAALEELEAVKLGLS